MKQISFEAIGTVWWIEIFDEISDETLAMVKDHCERFCDRFDKRFSRFKADSLLSKLNRERVLHEPDEECRALLTYGKELYLRSGTAFNYLTGHILEARGYDTDYSFKATVDNESLPVCNPVTDISINEEVITISCGNVDVGGYGKGYLIDLIATELRTLGFEYFLVNAGGDMYATSNHGESIEIYLEHPTKERTVLMPTKLLNQGFAASSPFKRAWKHEGKTYTHIVSNKEVPALAVFVKAQTAVEADAFTKSALLLNEAELLLVASREQFSCARYNPATNELWQSASFT